MTTRIQSLSGADFNAAALPRLTRLPFGTVSFLAGSETGVAGDADGTGSNVRFTGPAGIVIEPTATYAYVADSGVHRIKRVLLSTGAVVTVAGDTVSGDVDNTGTNARFTNPFGLVQSPDGLTLYIADTNSYRIKKMIVSSAVVTTLAGTGSTGNADGTGTSAAFGTVYGLAMHPDGTRIYLADYERHKVRVMDLATNAVSVLAGSGTAAEQDGIGILAQFNQPYGLAIDPLGNYLYVADYAGRTIRRIHLSTGVVTTIAGSGANASIDGYGRAAAFMGPAGLVVDPTGSHLYIASRLGEKIRKLNLSTGKVTTFAGTGTLGHTNGDGTAASFSGPFRLALTPDGSAMYATEYSGDRVRKIV